MSADGIAQEMKVDGEEKGARSAVRAAGTPIEIGEPHRSRRRRRAWAHEPEVNASLPGRRQEKLPPRGEEAMAVGPPCAALADDENTAPRKPCATITMRPAREMVWDRYGAVARVSLEEFVLAALESLEACRGRARPDRAKRFSPARAERLGARDVIFRRRAAGRALRRRA